MAASHKSSEVIDGRAIKSLVEAQALQSATILGQPGGWAVLVRYGNTERAVAAQRARRARLWRNLSTAAAYVSEELGLPRFEVDTADHRPDAIERKRPDSSERLRRQREAADYDTWFRARAQEGIEAADRGEFVPEDEVRERFARMLGK
jgi:predicted transcriptional regulator